MDYGFIPNLHVVLLGDSQRAGAYLPYGKQLVRQLLASRQPYGKRVVSPEEGVLAEAWVSGDHRWVRITAGGCPPFFMESGIIGLQDIGLGNPGLFGNDGVVHYNTAIRAYSEDKRLLGTLSRPPALGSKPTVEKYATPAMKATLDDDGKRDENSETTLAYKKLCASRVPPSVFTGKLRLYFQAKYGTRLAGWQFSMNITNAPPSLDWRFGESDNYPAGGTFQFHSAHTGIYTDADKRHWLVQLGVKTSTATHGVANVFKLSASPCIEKLRALLLDPDVSEVDKERIEAYILADSYPDPDFCISKPITLPTNWSLGYGWHFNWDGDKADIVEIETLGSGSTTRHKSSHYRVNISRDATKVDDPTNTALENETRRWEFSLETVEVAEWKNYKWFNVIAYPDWSESKLQIFGDIDGDVFGDAPIYCFYNRNDLKTLRFSASGGDTVLISRVESDPPYYVGVQGETPGHVTSYPCPSPGQTCGYEAGRGEIRRWSNTDFSVAFACGGQTVSGTESTYEYGFRTTSEKTRTGYGARYSNTDVWIGTGVVSPRVSGRPDSINTQAPYSCYLSQTNHYEDVTGYLIVQGIETTYSYTATSGTGTHTETVKLLAVVPFADAEAVYLWGQKNTRDVETGTARSMNATGGMWGGGHLQTTVYAPVPAGPEIWIENQNTRSDLGSVVATSAHTKDELALTPLGAYVVCNSGAQVFDPVSVVSAFFSGEPNTHVEQQFWTRSSAGLNKDIEGDGVLLTGGYDAALNNKPWVFSGWA